jgi:hypothetical protein
MKKAADLVGRSTFAQASRFIRIVVSIVVLLMAFTAWSKPPTVLTVQPAMAV